MAMYAAAWSRSRTINAVFVLFAIAGVMLVISHLLHPTIRGYELQLGVGFAIAGLLGQIYATALEILRLSEADRMERVAFWAATVGFVAIILAVQAIERTSSQYEEPRAITIVEPLPPLRIVAPADTIDPAWTKSQAKAAAFTMSDGRVCGAEGDGEDTITDIRKNRVDVPLTYYDVQWSAIASVSFPRNAVLPKVLIRWPDAEKDKILQFDDIPVRAVGYIRTIRPQAGNAESTNCYATKSVDTDWHIAFVRQAGDPEQTSVVSEITPRVRVSHPAWTRKNLKPWIDTALPVRFSGWLLFDPEHKNHLGRFRQTLWEIHPITKIEVSKDGEWMDLDTVTAK